MNKNLLLTYMLSGVEEAVAKIDEWFAQQDGWDGTPMDERRWVNHDLQGQLLELYSRREKAYVPAPADLPDTPDNAIPVLRDLYKDDVSKISLILNHYFPDQYFFYRVSKLEGEIFQGFDFFSDVIPQFRFEFDRVGQTGFDRYLRLNAALRRVAKKWWPRIMNRQYRMERFLYNNLASMFLETSDYNRYWICSTQHEYWQSRHEYEAGAEGVISWSGRKDMRKDDIVFLYCSAPVKAITDVYQVDSDAREPDMTCRM